MSDNIGRRLLNVRLQTIARLNELADEIDTINKNSKIAILTGTSASILGAVVGVPLGIAAIVLTGGAAAAPIGVAAAVFGGLGGAGGLTSFGAGVGRHFHVKSKHNQAHQVAAEQIEVDRALGRQLLDCCTLARGTFAGAGGIASATANGSRIAGNIIKAGDAAVDTLEVVAKVSKVAGSISVAVSVILLPVDIYVLVTNAKDIHTEARHEKAEEIRRWVNEMERSQQDLRNFVQSVDIQ